MMQGALQSTNSPIANFYGGDPNNRGGIRVAVKNLDRDPFADLVTGAGEGSGRVSTYLGMYLAAGSALENYGFDAFPGSVGGVFVG
jgi:hypothetical protein